MRHRCISLLIASAACGTAPDAEDPAVVSTSTSSEGSSETVAVGDATTGTAGEGTFGTSGSETGTTGTAGTTGTTGATGTAGTTGTAGSTGSESGSTTGYVAPADAVPSPGCDIASAPTGIFEWEAITVGATQRQYVLVVPETYDAGQPHRLVFGFHGLWANAAIGRQQLNLEASGMPAIFVYPNASDPEQGWRMGEGDPDVAFFDALLEDLGNRYCLDASRVFAAGFSHGAMFTNNLACWRGQALRGIASVGGGGPRYEGCAGSMPAMVVHGDADTIVTLHQGMTTRDHWRRENTCGEETAEVEPQPCVSYDGCAAPVVWCEFAGGHTVPSFAGPGMAAFFEAL